MSAAPYAFCNVQLNVRTFRPDVPTRRNRENQQGPNENERFQVIRGHPLCREYRRPHKLTLRRTKTGPQHHRQTPTIRRFAIPASAGLQHLCSTGQYRIAVRSVYVQRFVVLLE